MATELDKLIVKVQADISDLQRGLAKANTAVTGASKKMSGGFDKANKSLDKFAMSALKVGSVVAGAIGVVAVKGFVDVAVQIENLNVRLKALFGSAEEGARAFDNMASFASKVPFSLAEIQRGSGSLAVVSDDADHLAELMEITGNVASITGLSFQATAEQIQRSFAGGIASADMFREKGVRQMLGFQMGATVSIEETAEAFSKVFGKGGKFGNATEELANTLTGTASMIGDKFFIFQRAVGDGFFGQLKDKMKDFNKALAENEHKIKAFANDIGSVLASAVEGFGTALSVLGTTLKAVFSLMIATFGVKMAVALFNIKKGIENVTKALVAFNGVLMASGIGGIAILIAKLLTAIAVFVGIDMALDKYNNTLDENSEQLKEQESLVKGVTSAYNLKNMSVKESAEVMSEEKKKAMALAETMKKVEDILIEVKKSFEDAGKSISDAFADAIVTGNSFKDAMKDIFRSIIQQIISTITHVLIIKPIIDSLTKSLQDAKAEMVALSSFGGGGGGSILDTILSSALTVFTGGGFGTGAPATAGTSVPVGKMFGSGYSDSSLKQLIATAGTARASGGFVSPSMPYLVGEKGAEMFMPKSAGTIIPNDKMGSGGVTINQNLNFSTGVVPTVQAEIRNLMPQIKKETVGAVAEARSRGGAFARTFGA